MVNGHYVDQTKPRIRTVTVQSAIDKEQWNEFTDYRRRGIPIRQGVHTDARTGKGRGGADD